MKEKTLDVVVPVYNEEDDLPVNIPRLKAFLEQKMSKYDWEIVIVDNASTDQTPRIGEALSREGNIKYLQLDQKGRGNALKKAWDTSKANYLAYMDIDLSSDITYFPRLIGSLEAGSDIAIGSRLASGARVYGRPFVREMMSRGYSLLFRTLFRTSFKDAQCGFKAVKKVVWAKLSPLVKDKDWFFDSEVLIIADKAGFKITEIPIEWRDDPRSTVKVAKTAFGDIKGLFGLFREKPWKKL